MQKKYEIGNIIPTWQVPSNIKAFTTTVFGGFSADNYNSFNLGGHVGDDIANVNKNRELLQHNVGLNTRLCWLNQAHGDTIVNLSSYSTEVEGDASFSDCEGNACVIMTADCLPILLCNKIGSKVAAIHCGWKGLYNNLIAKTIKQYFYGDDVIAWLGPAIGQDSYEVDDKIYNYFNKENSYYKKAFIGNRLGHYLFDLYKVARIQLNNQGVKSENISGGGFDTFSDKRFFSYRRTAKTGRMASIIYITN